MPFLLYLAGKFSSPLSWVAPIMLSFAVLAFLGAANLAYILLSRRLLLGLAQSGRTQDFLGRAPSGHRPRGGPQ